MLYRVNSKQTSQGTMKVNSHGNDGSPGDDEEYTADSQVGQQDVDPDIRGHGVQEREEARVGAVWSTVQDTDAGVQERFGEVDSFLPHKGDCERSHSKVSSLGDREQNIWIEQVFRNRIDSQYYSLKFNMKAVLLP